MYLRDLSHSSFNNTETKLDPKLLNTLQPLWTSKPGGSLASAATLSGGVLYVGDWSGTFHALDAQTGREIWNAFVGKSPAEEPGCSSGLGVSSQATVVGGTVYVGGGDSAVYAFDKTSGKLQWRVSLADPASGSYLWSSIIPFQNSLFVGIASVDDCPLARGAIAQIDVSNPQQPGIKYLASSGNLGAGVWSSIAIDPASNSIFATTGNGDSQDSSTGDYSDAFVSLNLSTLDVQGSYLLPAEEADDDFDWGSSPTLFNAPDGTPLAVATAKDGGIYAVRRSDMGLVWNKQLWASCADPVLGCGSISTPAWDGATLFVGGGVRDVEGFPIGSVWALRPGDGSVIWEHDTDGAVVAPVTVANGLVFVPTTQGLEIYQAATGQFLWSDGKRGKLFSQAVVADGVVYCTYLKGEVVAWQLPPNPQNVVYNYSAATGWQSIAPNSIVSLYGENIGDASVTVTDSTGTSAAAQVLNSSAGLINYLIPYTVATGKATVTVDASGRTLSSTIQVSTVAPGIFTANADGKGVPAAQSLRLNTNALTPVFDCGASAGSCVPKAFSAGSASDPVFLILYGTGIAGRTAIENVTCTIGGVPAQVVYAGAQGSIDGLDQVNIVVPPSLAGAGNVNVMLSVDRQLANTVRIGIQ